MAAHDPAIGLEQCMSSLGALRALLGEPACRQRNPDDWTEVEQYHGVEPEALEFLEPEDLEELVAAGEIGPVQPSFELF
ncbi:hypothetical protein [Streptomyces sp. NPDC018036]|uniref:hypothetical protein n=1 Tax=Streptomyces sp. NPDC018036 TaxID=3365035 RepID=UPI0037AA049A